MPRGESIRRYREPGIDVTAIEAKSGLDQMRDLRERKLVATGKFDRRHSVLLLAAHDDALVAASSGKSPEVPPPRSAEAFQTQ